jgi:hypothetical protein
MEIIILHYVFLAPIMGPTLAPLWAQYGPIVEPNMAPLYEAHNGAIMGPYWVHDGPGHTMGPYWFQYGSSMDLYAPHYGPTLCPSWAHTRPIVTAHTQTHTPSKLFLKENILQTNRKRMYCSIYISCCFFVFLGVDSSTLRTTDFNMCLKWCCSYVFVLCCVV